MIRALLYVGMARGAVDERGFEMIRRIRERARRMPQPALAEFKALVREQFFMLLIDPEAALAAIPVAAAGRLRETRAKALRRDRAGPDARAARSAARTASGWREIARLFGVGRGAAGATSFAAREDAQTKARSASRKASQLGGDHGG